MPLIPKAEPSPRMPFQRSWLFFGSSILRGAGHRYIYMAVGSQGQTVAPTGIGRFDCETGRWSSGCPKATGLWVCLLPPRVKQRRQEDAGFVGIIQWQGRRQSEIVILETSDMAVITRIPLGMVVPHGLFGCFAATEEAAWGIGCYR
jgi:carotenoid cleavage dioxygenase-like enzyme